MLLKEKTLNSITVTEICQMAQVNRGTFYAHYGQIENLFEEYFKEIMKDLIISYQEPYKHVRILITSELNPATIRIFHHIEKYKKFYRIVFSKNAPISYYYLLFDQIDELLKKDLEHNGEKEIEIAILSAYQANAILGMVIEWYKQDFQQSSDYLNQQLVLILNVK
ncbi:TetR/AcrR family transcriptional regulator [Paenisporosarcina antarctica]|uniref:TetR/AcrR family transcriptional regulator n=2 Tax=Paenisporosarcina antarctica TaxID=417367 RepID=A0A4P7A383_9BACL|nr:TetR/AcrR family transcriptional regulator [Paenisporosarcina antarctica]